MKTLFKKNASGSIDEWSISGSIPSSRIQLMYGQVGGNLQIKNIPVKPMANRDIREQLILEIRSRISRQRDKGYRDTVEEAISCANTNSLDLPRPMLAQPFSKVGTINLDDHFFQLKYNGHRCLIASTIDGLVAYSRNGKPITSIDHILNHLDDLPVGEILDGELYTHNTPLQTIASWVKRKQPNTDLLRYVVYDCISNKSYEDRFSFICKYIGFENPIISIATTKAFCESDTLDGHLKVAIKRGYEGLILRHKLSQYESGKRSKSLIKVKSFQDDEFYVYNIESSNDGWAKLMCLTKDGKEFKVSAPGTMAQKREILDNAPEYIGQHVKVEFAEYTKDGIPFHPVAIMFRDINNE